MVNNSHDQSLEERSECGKWSEVHDDAVIIQEFLDFCSNQGITLNRLNDIHGEIFIDNMQSREDLIYKHFGIDKEKLEQERVVLLRSIQKHG